jgi:hypothetical protein
VNYLNYDLFQTLSKSKYKLSYDRLYDRSFDNKNIKQYINADCFTNIDDGLKRCLRTFLENPNFKRIDWKVEALMDRLTEERTPLHEIHGLKQKVMYLRYRYLH